MQNKKRLYQQANGTPCSIILRHGVRYLSTLALLLFNAHGFARGLHGGSGWYLFSNRRYRA